MGKGHTDLAQFQGRLGVHFSDEGLLVEALTHRSHVHEAGAGRHNERLEFLGDAVLDLAVGEDVYRRFADSPEGELQKVRAALVCEPTLARVARHFQFDEYLRLGRGASQYGARNQDSVLSDGVEAVIGAVYLDSGWEAARALCLRLIAAEAEKLSDPADLIDDKSRLQEVLQERYKDAPTYHLVTEDGPDHAKTFTSEVRFRDEILGQGKGRSKKDAEQVAAARALRRLAKDARGG